MLQNEINFSIDGILNDNEKAKFDLKCDELIKKEKEFINLMNKYILSIKEMNNLKTRLLLFLIKLEMKIKPQNNWTAQL